MKDLPNFPEESSPINFQFALLAADSIKPISIDSGETPQGKILIWGC